MNLLVKLLAAKLPHVNEALSLINWAQLTKQQLNTKPNITDLTTDIKWGYIEIKVSLTRQTGDRNTHLI